jgi:hypothetical protein
LDLNGEAQSIWTGKEMMPAYYNITAIIATIAAPIVEPTVTPTWLAAPMNSRGWLGLGTLLLAGSTKAELVAGNGTPGEAACELGGT